MSQRLCYIETWPVDLSPSCSSKRVVCSQFANDTALIATAQSRQHAHSSLQASVTAAGQWLFDWHLMVNAGKTVTMRFSGRDGLHLPVDHRPILLNGIQLRTVSCHCHLGMELQCHLRWSTHVTTKITAASKLLFLARHLKPSITPAAMALIYTTYIRPKLEYGSLVYSSLSTTLADKLERFQRKAARLCLGLPLFKPADHSSLLHRVHWPTLSSRRHLTRLVFGYRLMHRTVPPHLMSLIPPQPPQPTHCLRHHRHFSLPTTRTSRQRDSPIHLSCHDINNLPISLSSITSFSSYKAELAPFILSSICASGSEERHYHPVCGRYLLFPIWQGNLGHISNSFWFTTWLEYLPWREVSTSKCIQDTDYASLITTIYSTTTDHQAGWSDNQSSRIRKVSRTANWSTPVIQRARPQSSVKSCWSHISIAQEQAHARYAKQTHVLPGYDSTSSWIL